MSKHTLPDSGLIVDYENMYVNKLPTKVELNRYYVKDGVEYIRTFRTGKG